MMTSGATKVPGEDLLVAIACDAERWYADVLALPPGPPGRAGLVRIRDEAVGRLRAGLPDRECETLLAMAPPLKTGPKMTDEYFADTAVQVREWVARIQEGAFLAIAARRAIRRGRPSDPRRGTSDPAADPADSPTVVV